MQRACFKRKAAGAPCVDQFGNPLPGETVHAVTTQQQQFEQWQQQQQQQPSPQHHNNYNYPPPQYAQMGANGGVGALWTHNPYVNKGGEFENVPTGFPLNY